MPQIRLSVGALRAYSNNMHLECLAFFIIKGNKNSNFNGLSHILMAPSIDRSVNKKSICFFIDLFFVEGLKMTKKILFEK